MINHKNLLQKSLEWYEMRWGKIGGTLSAGLFVKTDTLLIEVMSQRIEEFEPTDSFQTADMERGNELEPFAIEYLESYLGVKFMQSGWLQSEENELLGISPDGITECETESCEVKCFARKKHLDVLLKNEIPKENIHQCIHYFTVNPKLEKLHFIAFRPESTRHFIKTLTKDSIVNIGTDAKPVLKPIIDCVVVARKEAGKLLSEINSKTESLNF